MDEPSRQPRFVAETRADIATAFSNITNLYSKVKKMNKELEFLKNINVTQLQETIATINTFQNTISTLESSVASLESTSTAQQASITSLESTSTAQQSSI